VQKQQAKSAVNPMKLVLPSLQCAHRLQVEVAGATSAMLAAPAIDTSNRSDGYNSKAEKS
jgi:hypothetical protein